MSAFIRGTGFTNILGAQMCSTRTMREAGQRHCEAMLTLPRNIYWGAEIAENPPSVHYDEIMADDKGVGNWTEKIVRFPPHALRLIPD